MDMESVCDACERGERECGCAEPVTMNARVLRTGRCELLVCDLCGSQEVLVHTDSACCFQPGQCVCVTYSGAMTRSVPPQITADCVKPLNNGGCCR